MTNRKNIKTNERFTNFFSLISKEVAISMEEYIIRAIKGEHTAILYLIEQDEEILYRIAFTYLKNEQDTLDVMQELTYKALKKMHTVKQPEYARTWLVRVLINCCNDLLKRKLKTIELNEKSHNHYPLLQRTNYIIK